MTTAYPGALDTFANPLAGDTLASPSHAAQHANANDLIELLMGDVFNVRAYDAPGDGTVQTDVSAS